MVELIRQHTRKPLCLDTDGAQVRCGSVESGVVLLAGKVVRLTPEPVSGTAEQLSLRPGALFSSLPPGHLLSVDFNGALLRVVQVQGDAAEAIVLEEGAVGSNRADRTAASLPALTEADIRAIRIGRELGVRHVALSFARRPQDVSRLRKLAGPDAIVISKIETRAGVRNMDAIISASDAVIVDRGDLSREVPLAHVPMHQKEIIRQRGQHASLRGHEPTRVHGRQPPPHDRRGQRHHQYPDGWRARARPCGRDHYRSSSRSEC
jgi:pyruvate kinase